MKNKVSAKNTVSGTEDDREFDSLEDSGDLDKSHFSGVVRSKDRAM